MPAICNLYRLWRTRQCPFCKIASAITTDDSNARVRLQPGGEGVGFGIWQHINGLLAFQIDNQGAIGAAFADRPIVHPDDLGCWWRRQRLLALQAQQGRGADRHAQLLTDLSRSLSAEAKGKLTKLGGKSVCTPREGANSCPESLGEDFSFTA